MFNQLFRLKIKILLRALQELTFFGKVVLLTMLAALCYAIYALCDQPPMRHYLPGAVALLILFLHLRRKDYHFCRKLLPHPCLLFALEYFLVAAPFLLITLVKAPTPLCAIYALAPAVIAVLPRRNAPLRRSARPFRFPMPDLETVSLFRRAGLLIWGLLLLALALCFAPAVSVVIVYLLVLFASASFDQSESLTLLCLEELPARQFLRRKIRRQVAFWTTLTLPVLVLYAVLHLDTAYHVLVPVVLCPLQIAANVSARYSVFHPNRTITGRASLALCLLGYLIPILAPVSIVLTVVYYFDAIRNLNTYLYAYHR